jgi:hypothetical protein
MGCLINTKFRKLGPLPSSIAKGSYSVELLFPYSRVGCSLDARTIIWPIIPAPKDRWLWVWTSRWNEWLEKPKYPEKTCPSPTWIGSGSNTGRLGGKPLEQRHSLGLLERAGLDHVQYPKIYAFQIYPREWAKFNTINTQGLNHCRKIVDNRFTLSISEFASKFLGSSFKQCYALRP